MQRVVRSALLLGLLSLPGAAAGDRADLSWVQSWAIQLQGADIDELVDCSYDVVVIDYSRDGSADGEYTHAEIERVRGSGKTVLAYLSVGEAEDYRFYWKSKWDQRPPGWLGPENPDWPGNYKVKYWQSGWWNNGLQPYLDRILDAGFDGVFLDTVDSYWFWYEQGESVTTSANRMARLVERIGAYARDRAGPQFILCTNNGVGLLDDASSSWKSRYLAALDAVNAESLLYNIWSEEDRAYRLAKLAEFAAAGKRVFNVEYIALELVEEYFGLLEDQEFEILGYPAAPDRLLDELVVY